MRLISQDGTQLGIVPCEQALAKAVEETLDLVEVAPLADPPVCKIMDFGKYKYEQKKKQHAAKKQHHPQTKEIRLRLKTEEHDIQIKVKHAKEFLEKGDRVLISLRLRGREMAHADLARKVMDHFVSELEDIAKVDRSASIDRNRISMTLMPKDQTK